MWRYFGPEWLAFRLSYAARARTGLLRRRMPVTAWDEQPLEKFLNDQTLAEPERYFEYRRHRAPLFFFGSSRLEAYRPYFAAWDSEKNTPIIEADELTQGYLRYFEHDRAQVGFPPDWHLDPFSRRKVLADRHWSDVRDFGDVDIKLIWEP